MLVSMDRGRSATELRKQCVKCTLPEGYDPSTSPLPELSVSLDMRILIHPQGSGILKPGRKPDSLNRFPNSTGLPELIFIISA